MTMCVFEKADLLFSSERHGGLFRVEPGVDGEDDVSLSSVSQLWNVEGIAYCENPAGTRFCLSSADYVFWFSKPRL